MASEKEQIIFELIIGKDDLNSALVKARSSTASVEDNLTGLPKILSGVGKSINSAFSGIAVVATVVLSVAGAFSVLKDAIADAAKEQESIEKLNNQLKALGVFTDASSKSILDFADSMEKTTGISGELATDLITLSITMGASLEEAKRIVKLAPSLSKSFGGDVTGNVELLTKSLFGYGNGLKKLVPELKKLSEEQFINGDAFAFLEKRVGNLAESQFLNTAKGQFENISIALGDLSKGIGRVIVEMPEFIGLLNSTAKGIYFLAESVVPVKNSIVDAFRDIGKIFNFTTGIFRDTQKAFTAAMLDYTSIPLQLVGAGEKVEDFARTLQQVFQIVRAAETSGFTIEKPAKKITGDLQSLQKELFGTGNLVEKLGNIADTTKEPLQGLGKNVEQLKSSFSKLDQFKFDQLKEAISKISVDTNKSVQITLNERTSILDKALKNNKISEEEYAKAIIAIRKDAADEEEKILAKQEKEREAADKKRKEFLKNITEVGKALTGGATNFIKVLSSGNPIVLKMFNALSDIGSKFLGLISTGVSKITGATGGFLSKAASGVSDFLGKMVSGISSALGAFGLGIGEAVNLLVEVFGATPEEFAKNMKETLAGIGDLLSNILINSANLISREFFQGIIDDLPLIMKSLAFALSSNLANPALWVDVGIAFSLGIIKAIPEMIQGFIDGLRNGFSRVTELFGNDLKELPKKFFDEFRSLFEKFNPVSLLSKLFKLDSGGEGPVEKFLGLDFPFVKFAQGGLVGGKAKVSGDSNLNDLIPALLSPGEIVLPRSAISGGVGQVLEFLKSMGMNIPGFGFGGKIGKSIGGSLGKALDVITKTSGSVVDATGTTVRSIFGNQVGNLFDDIIGATGLGDKFTEIIRSLLKIGAQFDPIKLVRDPKPEIFNALNSVKGFLTEPLKKALKIPGLESGGMIPSGFNNDNFYAGLSSGEFVVNNKLTPKLENFLDNQNSNSNMDITNALLSKLLQAIQQPMSVDTNINIGQESIANVILKLNRSNQRLA